MNIKKVIGKVHLWLGLASGIIVVFLGITGCILAFEKEIRSFTESYQYVEKQNKPFLAPSEFRKIAEAQLPGKHAHNAAYQGPDHAIQSAFYSEDYYYIVYMNPYTGEVLKVKDMNSDFFRIIIMGHYYLWLPPSIGQPIVASATLIFVIMMITGLILWWPKSKSARKQRFSVKWNAKWRRVNYDLHNVFGFYMTWVAIFIALTGMVMGFQWFSTLVYKTASGGESMVEFYMPSSPKGIAPSVPAVDQLYNRMAKEYPNIDILEVHFPDSDTASIEIAANPRAGTYYKSDYRYFNQYTLEEIEVTHSYGKYEKATAAQKLMRMNYDIHIGAIWGIAGKFLAFFGSLIAASLPITGFMIWWGRKNKKKKTATAAVRKTKSGVAEIA